MTPRTLWTLFEPVHAVTYFSPHARAAYESAGLRGYWRGYFAGRAAALGPVGAGPVIAAFFGFHPTMVRRALPDVWSRATPEATLAARLAGAREALRAVLDDRPVDELADLLRRAVTGIDVVGRVLGAAHADLPWPDDPLGTVWHATTILREHRGDGHVAALLVEGLDGPESLVWKAALDRSREFLQPNRGLSDEDWSAATGRLTMRGWLSAAGSPTDKARAARERIEATTDRLAAEPWDKLGGEDTTRLVELLAPVSAAARTYLPERTPIGLPATGDRY